LKGGGAEVRINLLLDEFKKREEIDNIHFVYYGESNHKQEGKIHFWQTLPGRVPKVVQSIIDKFGVDIVQQHNTQEIGVKAVKVAKENKIPSIFFAHDFRTMCPHFFFIDVWKAIDKECCYDIDVEKCYACANPYSVYLMGKVRETLSNVDVGISATKNMTDIFERNNFLVGKWREVTPWVDVYFYQLQPEFKKLRMQGIFAGNYIPHKGAWVIVKAWKIVSKRLPTAVMYLQGDQRSFNLITHLIRFNNLRNINTLRRMKKEELRHVYCESTFTVFPSIWEETFGLIRGESLACGTPVIASCIGGITETSKYGHVLFEPRNHEMLAEKMIDLFLDVEKTRVLAAEGRKYALETFHPQRACEEMIKIYETLI
jgi:glycosyltransferase involved in cell wall biosynthesis